MKKWIWLAAFCVLALPFANAQEPKPTMVTKSFIAKYIGPVNEEEWVKRGRHGQVITVMSNGVVLTDNYLEGHLNGTSTVSFPHRTTPQYSVTYRQGAVQERSVYYPSGRVASIETFPCMGERNLEQWYSDGTLRSQERYRGGYLVSGIYYDHNQRQEAMVSNGQGERIIRDGQGKLLREDLIMQGIAIERTFFYGNGEPWAVEQVAGCCLHGERKIYDVGGVPLSRESWANGKQEGITTLFHNGEPIALVPYHGGDKHGVERRFQEDQVLTQEVSWKKGKLHGPTTMYIDGRAYTQWFYEGKKINETTYNMLEASSTTISPKNFQPNGEKR